MRRPIASLAIAAALTGLAVTASTAAATSGDSSADGSSAVKVALRGSTHPLIPNGGQRMLPRRNATVSSTNWSGFAVVASGVTEVRSTFVVPTVQAGSQGYASTWTGIGGYNTGDLIQAGIAEEQGGKYYAWVERLPAAASPISGCVGDAACKVLPGDKPYVRIYKKSGVIWNVTIVNVGHGDRWTWTKDVFYTSRQSSVEWILEAPTVGGTQAALAHVGRVFFGPSSVYKAGGVLRSIAGGNPVRITLDQAGGRQATPSNLAADGQRFNDCSYALTCPTP